MSATGSSCDNDAVLESLHSCGGGIIGGEYLRSGRTATSGNSADLSRLA